MEIFGKYCLGMAEAQAASNSYTSSGCQWCKDYQSWINFNEDNYQLCISQMGDAHMHHQICQSKFQHVYLFDQHFLWISGIGQPKFSQE